MKIFNFLVLSITLNAFGQNISFEDINLKTAIIKTYPNVDVNKDGEISYEEAKKLTSIRNLYSVRPIISAEGIEAFVNLKELNLSKLGLQKIDVSKLKKLQVLNLRENKLSGRLDVSMLPELKTLELNKNEFKTVLLPKQDKINTIYINENQLTEIDVTGMPNLQRLFLVKNNIKSLNLSENTALQRFHIDGNQLKTLDVSNLSKLNWMSVADNQLTNLISRGNIKLRTILAKNNQLTVLNFRDKAINQLKILNLDGNKDFSTIIKDCEDTLPSNLNISITIDDGCYNLSVSHIVTDNLKIYPNPTTDYVMLRGKISVPYEIYAQDGKYIRKGVSNDGRVNFSELIKGVYLLKWQYNDIIYTEKVIKR